MVARELLDDDRWSKRASGIDGPTREVHTYQFDGEESEADDEGCHVLASVGSSGEEEAGEGRRESASTRKTARAGMQTRIGGQGGRHRRGQGKGEEKGNREKVEDSHREHQYASAERLEPEGPRHADSSPTKSPHVQSAGQQRLDEGGSADSA